MKIKFIGDLFLLLSMLALAEDTLNITDPDSPIQNEIFFAADKDLRDDTKRHSLLRIVPSPIIQQWILSRPVGTKDIIVDLATVNLHTGEGERYRGRLQGMEEMLYRELLTETLIERKLEPEAILSTNRISYLYDAGSQTWRQHVGFHSVSAALGFIRKELLLFAEHPLVRARRNVLQKLICDMSEEEHTSSKLKEMLREIEYPQDQYILEGIVFTNRLGREWHIDPNKPQHVFQLITNNVIKSQITMDRAGQITKIVENRFFREYRFKVPSKNEIGDIFPFRASAAADQETHMASSWAIGIRFARKGGSWIVTKVYPGSPAADTGIKDGDILVKVNEKCLSDMTLWNIREYFDENPRVKIMYKRGEQEIEALIQKRMFKWLIAKDELLPPFL